MAGYQQLRVWQRGMDLAVDIYRLTKQFPKDELYGLTSQSRRAASSVPANLAEGRGRGTTREYHRFVGIALGSVAELETHLILAQRLGHASEVATERLLNEYAQLTRMLGSLRRSLRTRMHNEKRNK